MALTVLTLADFIDDVCPICQQVVCDHTPEQQDALRVAQETGRDLPFDAGDAGQVASRTKAIKRADTQHLDDLRFLMRHVEGRRFVWRLLSMAHISESTYVRGRGDGMAMAFAEGERNLGLQFFAELQAHCLDDYLKMVREAHAKGA